MTGDFFSFPFFFSPFSECTRDIAAAMFARRDMKSEKYLS